MAAATSRVRARLGSPGNYAGLGLLLAQGTTFQRDPEGEALISLTDAVEQTLQAHRILHRVWSAVAESVVIAGRGEKAATELSEDVDHLIALAARRARDVHDKHAAAVTAMYRRERDA